MIKKFKKDKYDIHLHDPYALKEEVQSLYNEKITEYGKLPKNFDVVVLSIPHKFYLDKGFKSVLQFMKKKSLLADLKSAFKDINDKNIKIFRL